MLNEAERQRIADCVNGCQGIGNPLALPDLINALAGLIDCWAEGDSVAPESAAVQELREALQKLELSMPPDE